MHGSPQDASHSIGMNRHVLLVHTSSGTAPSSPRHSLQELGSHSRASCNVPILHTHKLLTLFSPFSPRAQPPSKSAQTPALGYGSVLSNFLLPMSSSPKPLSTCCQKNHKSEQERETGRDHTRVFQLPLTPEQTTCWLHHLLANMCLKQAPKNNHLLVLFKN